MLTLSTAASLAVAAALIVVGPPVPEESARRTVEAPPRQPDVDGPLRPRPSGVVKPDELPPTGPPAPAADGSVRLASGRRVEDSDPARQLPSLPSDVSAPADTVEVRERNEPPVPPAPAVVVGPVRRADDRRPRTATIEVLMPNEKAELVVRGEVGKGNPDEWYGPKRVVHTPPLPEGADYLIGAFFLDDGGHPVTRSRPIRIEPGKLYEVDLRPARPTSREIARPDPDRPARTPERIMRTTRLVAALAILVLTAGEARACGRRCGCRRGHPRAVVARPYSYAPAAYYPQPTALVEAPSPAASPAYPAAVQAPPAIPENPVQPLYTYEASPENGVAYYYTYDDSGNLVIKQWMDWLFRGGRRAGLPAPPLPLIGRTGD